LQVGVFEGGSEGLARVEEGRAQTLSGEDRAAEVRRSRALDEARGEQVLGRGEDAARVRQPFGQGNARLSGTLDAVFGNRK